jgi:hypothetical protein
MKACGTTSEMAGAGDGAGAWQVTNAGIEGNEGSGHYWSGDEGSDHYWSMGELGAHVAMRGLAPAGWVSNTLKPFVKQARRRGCRHSPAGCPA